MSVMKKLDDIVNEFMDNIPKSETNNNNVKKAIKLLRDNGYYVDSLYHIEDVKNHYDCEDEIAQEILGRAIDNDGTSNQIWESVMYVAEDEYNLTPKE